MQEIFLKHGLPVPRRYRSPMSYQSRLALAFAAGFTAFAAFCFVAFLLTSKAEIGKRKPESSNRAVGAISSPLSHLPSPLSTPFPDIIATQPDIGH